MSFIPLLSSRPIHEFTPAEFKAWVRSLYKERRKKKARGPKKRLKITARVLRNGDLSVITRRNPKYLTEGELREIEQKTGKPANEVFIAVKGKGFLIYESHEEYDRIEREIREIPWG